MSLIRIESGDWLKNASIVGIIKVLRNKRKSNENIEIASNYIQFDSSMLEDFEEAYFETIFEEYGKKGSWNRLVGYIDTIEILKKEEFTFENIEKLNKIIKDAKEIIKSSSYKSAYILIEDGKWIESKESVLKKINCKKKDDPENHKDSVLVQLNLIKDIIKWFNRKDVKRLILAKNVMYDYIQPFWNNISILLSNNSNKDMYKLYKNDFIDSTINYINSDTELYKNNCFTCDKKIKTLNKPNAFDLTWLVKTGVDMRRKSSHFWNMNGDAYICPVCNLLYSCLPIGFKTINNKGIFINFNHNINVLYQANVVKINEDISFSQLENISYYNVINSMNHIYSKNIEKEFENIQVVKIDGNNSLRPYSFSILSPNIMKVIYRNKKNLEYLIKIKVEITEKYSINLYNEVINRIYEGKNLFDLINKLLFIYLDGKFNNIKAIRNIIIINNFLLGGKAMRIDDINKFENYGYELRKSYYEKNAEAKLVGIIYRLLNSIKIKDSSKFMDTTINSYMYLGKSIPKGFSLALSDSDRLQNIGYAFILGLQGEINKDSKKGDEGNE